MPDMKQIEQLTENYATRRAALQDVVSNLTAQLDAIKRQNLPIIRALTGQARDARDTLYSALSDTPALFRKPRTKTFHGIKVGYAKQKGKVVIDDEEAVISRIRAKLPKDQAELLIRRTEAVHKPAVYDLIAADLKRLGIKIEDDVDVVVIKTADAEVDKIVAALLDDAGDIEEEAA